MNQAQQTLREYNACPPIGDRAAVARQAQYDAMDLATDVRELDPRQVWGKLRLMGADNPVRLVALSVALAAMVDVEKPASELLAWVNDLGRKIRNVA